MSEERHFDERLASIARDLLNEPDVEQTVQRVVDLAAEHLRGVIYASVSLVRQRRRVETPASSDDRALHADPLQYEVGEGPCLDAIWEQETFQIDDMTTEERYPTYSRRVAEQTGIRSSLSLQLFTDEDSLGALNLYSPQPRAFDEAARAEGSCSLPRRPWRCAALSTRSNCAPGWRRATSSVRPRASSWSGSR
jgi:GAF domain-containing protein